MGPKEVSMKVTHVFAAYFVGVCPHLSRSCWRRSNTAAHLEAVAWVRAEVVGDQVLKGADQLPLPVLHTHDTSPAVSSYLHTLQPKKTPQQHLMSAVNFSVSPTNPSLSWRPTTWKGEIVKRRFFWREHHHQLSSLDGNERAQ